MTPIANDYPFPPASSAGKPPAAKAKRFENVLPVGLSKESDTVAAALIPKDLRRVAKFLCKAEGITFSQFMRRALRRELGDTVEAAR